MRIWIALTLAIVLLAGPASAREFNPKRVYQTVSPRVVLITGFEPGQKFQGMGTGSIIREDGLVLTNAHVVVNASAGRPYSELRVFLKPQRLTGNLKKDTQHRFKARLLIHNRDLDLALLQIESPSGSYSPVGFLNANQIGIGDRVLAIGHPESGGLWTLTTGTISSHMQDFQNIPGKNVFQTETSLNRGNSGGPLLDANGLMVGINSNIARKSKDGLAITDINFSIKSNVAVAWLNENGYHFGFTAPQMAKAEVEEPYQPSGIVPTPKPKAPKGMAEPESNAITNPVKETVRPKPEVEMKPKPKPPVQETAPEPGPQKEAEILTEKRPYKMDDLFAATEEEMEEMMDDIKKKLKGRNKGRFNFDDF
ncbi:serine protease Do [Nitrospina gracilis]|nr:MULTISPECIES: trypsin-like peptidase domain-containing protein [Nitrospina]MCF8722839.1 serine protease Do [Nitrospina sp. Nb-3]